VPTLDNVHRVLILRCGALGDLVCATTVIEALRAQYGDVVTIDFVCTPSASGLFEFDDRVHQVFPLRQRHVPLWLSPQKQAVVRASKHKPYDLLLNLESGQQFTSLVTAIEARHKSGWLFSNPAPAPLSHLVDICKAGYADVVDHEILTAALPSIRGKPFQDVKTTFALPDAYLTVSPGNSHRRTRRLNHRAWSSEHWHALIEMLPPDLPVVVIGAKGDEPLSGLAQARSNRIINLAGKTTIAEMITIISHAKGLIVTDTGTAHVAAATATPVFCLHGPTNAAISGPYSTPHNVVHTLSVGLPCSPCHDTPVMRQCRANLCMQQITPQRVMHSLQMAGIIA
jgi:ADP-heptose:LPS heptosyltransferase